MCCKTKHKIAEGLTEVLKEKPLKKITVQDIMDSKEMKRQSFYYHFQDIYSVVEWVLEEDFAEASELSGLEPQFDTWVCNVTEIISKKHFFYHKVMKDISRERMIMVLYPIVEKEVKATFQNMNALLENFIIRSICHFFFDMVELQQSANKEDVLEALHCFREIAQKKIYTMERNSKNKHVV